MFLILKIRKSQVKTVNLQPYRAVFFILKSRRVARNGGFNNGFQMCFDGRCDSILYSVDADFNISFNASPTWRLEVAVSVRGTRGSDYTLLPSRGSQLRPD